MRVGGRELSMWAREVVELRNYRALAEAVRHTERPVENLRRYLTAAGQYPYAPAVRTPMGVVHPMLDSFHDMMTFNEVFLRGDYALPPGATTVVDVGSNKGISALYFLTRSPDVRVWLHEPVPANLERLRANLVGYEERYVLTEAAVGTASGPVRFNVEPTGRYGGIGVATAEAITVTCRHVDEVLGEVLEQVPRIDLLKVDIEGLELEVVEGIDPALLSRIGTICFESDQPGLTPLADAYTSTSRNETYRLVHR